MNSRTAGRLSGAGHTGAVANCRTLLSLVAMGVAVALPMLVEGAARGASGGDPKAGKEPYEKLCAVCHGASGRGDGPALRGMPVRPKSFADPAAFRDVTDQALFEAIQKGGAATGKSPIMPPFGDQLKEGQIRDLLAYLRSLAPPAR